MAITSFDITYDKIPMKSSCSTHSSKCGNSCRLLKINFAADGSLSNVASKRGKTKKMNSKSPYLTGDRVQLLSRITEKRLVHKKTTDFVSSFPLAVNIYKANSDEFKSSKKANKKVKKSVLTLPNDPAPVPQVCTVSDMNDSEYCAKNDEDRKQKVIKKRTPIQNNRKARVREKDFEFYDRDAQYCSQLNINLDCSSTDMMKNFNGDGKRVYNKKKISPTINKSQTANNNLSDVWTVLRNINRFQFRPSPPLSEESIIPIKKKVHKRRANHKDTRVIETCRTEEFAYISSYEVDEKTPRCFSPSSSIDRITVIDKQNEFSKICEEFEKRLLKTHDFLKDSNNSKNPNPKNKILCKNAKNNVRTIGNIGTKENKQLIPLKRKKRITLKPPPDLLYSSEPTNSSEHKDSLIDVDSLPIADNSDVSSHKTANDSMYPAKGSFVYSDNSGSSKAALPEKTKNERCIPVKDKSHEQSSSHLKGIPKVVLNPEQPRTEPSVNLVEPKRLDPQKRKPRLVTTMPSSCMMPKLTQTEIKRRLAQLRFPIVILGKDQVSSSMKVSNDDPPQFDGLDSHIWPFMIKWSENTTKDPKEQDNITNKKFNSFLSDPNSNKSRKINSDVSTCACKQTLFNKKLTTNDSTSTNKKKTESKRLISCSEMNDKLLQSSKKQKSIVQLKDKMLNFLYKKSSCRNVIPENEQNDTNKYAIAVNKVDASTDTQVKPIMILNELPKRRAFQSPIKKTQNFGYPWAKAKWASDFIENVIKKLRSGVYYSQDNVLHKYRIELKEVSVQAGSICDSSDTQTRDSDTNLAREVAITKNQKSFTSIPGFNNTLPLLEIKTLNMNQISVKHCVTNVMVQFDVTVPAKSDKSTASINQSLSLIPIEVTESHTKIFKCKTTILNAMLPAELCSILPKMMSNIINSNVTLDRPALCPAKTDSCLSTITELTRYETADSLSIITSFHMSIEMKLILEGGRFSSNKMSYFKKPLTNYTIIENNYKDYLVTELLPKVSLQYLLQYEVSPRLVELNHSKFTHLQLSLEESYKPIAINNIHNLTCTPMNVHSGNNNKTLNTVFTPFNFIGMIKSIILSYYNLQINRNLSSYEMLKLQCDGKNIEISMAMKNSNGVQNNVSITVSNLKIDSLYKALPKIKFNSMEHVMKTKNSPLKCIEYINTSLANKLENTEVNQVTSNKMKRNGFYKLYRKCKSTTNIPSGEKSANTPLNKVTTLDDFFQILGSKKNLCSVFDGYAAKKILSSIIEMKNWIPEINPKQALLILLLTNKKDTPNLVRFRPILLQGIAVNRITRATELDMEIEVIERENLNKFSQYEGISYLPESVANYDNLLEELYWIAKTTASDYQRPFDESSERLLKSLLGKRKKLNPSYLRVMARYVGLGLLKPPTKI